MYKSKNNIKMGTTGKKVIEKEGRTKKDIQEKEFWKGMAK
jgi:hypothetical protein